jgi:F-type H+-transporting ATPase subunit delta
MLLYQSSLAKKYARAFLSIAQDSITLATIDNMKSLAHYLKEHRETLFYLKLSSINDDIKQEVLKRLYARFELSSMLEGLTHLLAMHKRFFLLPSILEQIVKLYCEEKSIAEYKISSVVPLTESQKNSLHAFIGRKTGTTPLLTYTLDPTLLAGIRVQGDLIVWEHSLRKQLRAIETAFKD